jgi:YHS domain-containing protein
MAVILWILFKVTLRQRMVDDAKRQADRGVFGSTHEAHGEMDISITDGPFLSRLFSPRAFTAIAHSFYMDLNALYVDLGLGFLIAGALAAWVPNSWWQAFFLTNHPTLNAFWGPLIGPVISMLSFVCSVGNVPLAVVLWNGGISFGGVISFIFADLIILPILNIYRKYYGGRTALYLLIVSYAAMVVAGFLIGGAFQLLGLVPTNHHVAVFETRPTWNYTTFLDIAFLVLMAVLAWRFVTTGGIEMLRAHARRPAAVVEPVGHLAHSHVMAATPGGEMERPTSAIDPVCGMTVDPERAEYRSFQKGETYYFCSAGCKKTFDKDPAKYISRGEKQ